MRSFLLPPPWVGLAVLAGCEPAALPDRVGGDQTGTEQAAAPLVGEPQYAEVARRPMKRADLVLERDADGMGRLSLQPVGLRPEPIPCDRLEGAWGLWVDDVDGDGRAEALVALRKRARFDPKLENRLHVYSFEGGVCVPAWRGTRLSGRFEALAQGAEHGVIVANERLSPTRRRLARYRWRDFGYRLEHVLWEGEGVVPESIAAPYTFTEEPT